MSKQVWGQAVIVPGIIIPISLGIFAGLIFGLDLFHDFALAIATVLFIGITAGAWLLARRTEPS